MYHVPKIKYLEMKLGVHGCVFFTHMTSLYYVTINN
jgi:hypothetical protein